MLHLHVFTIFKCKKGKLFNWNLCEDSLSILAQLCNINYTVTVRLTPLLFQSILYRKQQNRKLRFLQYESNCGIIWETEHLSCFQEIPVSQNVKVYKNPFLPHHPFSLGVQVSNVQTCVMVSCKDNTMILIPIHHFLLILKFTDIYIMWLTCIL